jgi:chlorobactene glucosyltransferase
MIVLTLINFATMRSLPTYGFQQRFTPEAPLVSILVPARNEAGNIARCIRSLLNQDYPNFELLVLDDDSDDATASIVEMLSSPTEDPQRRLRLLKGEDLPEGWLGKNFACHQLAQAARGDFLLFTDADTSHSVNALSSAVAAMYIEDAQLTTFFPLQQTMMFGERLAVPLLQMYTYGLLPTFLVSRNPNPAFSASNGQFMLFSRPAYEHIGGHQAVRGVVLEDVVLGRRIKEAGFRLLLPDGRDALTCRMYRSNREVWNGFSKNLFAFFNFELGWLVLFLLLNLLVFVGPFFWLLLGFLTKQPVSAEWLWLPLAQLVLGGVLRLVNSTRYNFSLLDLFLQPVSILYMTAIAFNSVRWKFEATEWKGRKYRLHS